jgi:hypothetical protein
MNAVTLYERPIVPLSEVDEAWFNLFKVEFKTFMAETQGPYDIQHFLFDTLAIKQTYRTVANAMDHTMRYFCPIEVDIPRFEVQFFAGKYYDMRIQLLIDSADDNKDFIFMIETANDGNYKLFLSDIGVAALLRITNGYTITNHA